MLHQEFAQRNLYHFPVTIYSVQQHVNILSQNEHGIRYTYVLGEMRKCIVIIFILYRAQLYLPHFALKFVLFLPTHIFIYLKLQIPGTTVYKCIYVRILLHTIQWKYKIPLWGNTVKHHIHLFDRHIVIIMSIHVASDNSRPYVASTNVQRRL